MAPVPGLIAVAAAVTLAAVAAAAAEPAREKPKPRHIPLLAALASADLPECPGRIPALPAAEAAPDCPGAEAPPGRLPARDGPARLDNLAQLDNGVSALFASAAVRREFPAVVIAPQCPDGEGSSWSNWEPGKPQITIPTRLVLEIVEAACQEFPIDRARMYIGGLSMGGFGTWNVIEEFPDLFAAAFPICGGGDPKRADRIAQLPLWVFHGAKDEVVPPSRLREMVRAIQDAGGHPGYSEYPDVGHGSWTNAFEEPQLLPWLFAQRKRVSATGANAQR